MDAKFDLITDRIQNSEAVSGSFGADTQNPVYVGVEGRVVTIVKGEPERVVLEISCTGELLAGFLNNALTGVEDPLLKFQQLLSDRELHGEVIESIILKTPYGSIPCMFDGPLPILPPSPHHIALPSNFRDAGTGLLLSAGLVRALDGVNLSEFKVLTVAEFDVGNVGKANELHGPTLANELFVIMAAIAEEMGIKLTRLGGDEFTVVLLGESAAENQGRLDGFQQRYSESKDAFLAAHLDAHELLVLEQACREKGIEKGRQHPAGPFGLYLASASVPLHEVQRVVSLLDPGVVLKQLLGIVDHYVYELKNSPERIRHESLSTLSLARSADIEAVNHVRSIDARAIEMIQRLQVETLSHFERIAIYLELMLTCAEDPALDHGVLRAGRLDASVSHRGTIEDVINQFMPEAARYHIDLAPFGEVNSLMKAARADQAFGETVLKVHSLGTAALLVRTSGGGGTLILPQGPLTPVQCAELYDKLSLAFAMRVHVAEENAAVSPSHKIIPRISFERAA